VVECEKKKYTPHSDEWQDVPMTLSQASHRKAPVDEVLALVNQRVAMRNVISEARLERTHFHTWRTATAGTEVLEATAFVKS
jgi:hypothetical protein